MFTPCSSIWVAKLWRRVWQPTFLSSPACCCGSFHRLLQAGFEHVMAHLPARARVQGARTGRKHPMPAGLPRGLWVFPGQRFGDVHVSESLFKVLVMEGFHRLDLRLQRCPQVPGQDGRPVLTALGAPDKDEVLAEVHVVDAQADALQQAQAAAIEQPRHEGMPARHGGEQPLDLRLGEHGGRPWLAFAADRGDRALKGLVQDIPVEKHQGVQGLPLGGGRHLALGGQVGEKALHILWPRACSDGSCRRSNG